MQFFVEYSELLVVAALLVLGYGFGRFAEYRHYRAIRRREDEFSDLIIVCCKTVPETIPVGGMHLVRGSVVISVDYFKRFVARLRMIFGGRVHTYESLIDRGRREALLRMQAEARRLGATMVFNTRFETSSISKGRGKAIGCVEVLAYGTAILP